MKTSTILRSFILLPLVTIGASAMATYTESPDSTGRVVNPENAASNAITGGSDSLTMVAGATASALSAHGNAGQKGGGSSAGGFRIAGQNYMRATPTGIAGGETFNNLGLWGSYAYSDFDNDFSRTKYDGDRNMFFVGADFTPRDNMVLGLAIGYEDTSIDTDFNLGQLDADGWTIAPYFGMILNDTWSLDINAGWSDIDTDQDRSSGTITSDYNTDRWFVSANVSGYTQVNNWSLSGRTGLMNAESEDDSFTESNGTVVNSRATLLTQFSLGGEAAYPMGDFEPYVTATYNYDLHATETVLTAGVQPSNDDDDVLLGLGFRYFKDDNLSMSAQYDTRQGRSDFDEDTFSFNVRWDF